MTVIWHGFVMATVSVQTTAVLRGTDSFATLVRVPCKELNRPFAVSQPSICCCGSENYGTNNYEK